MAKQKKKELASMSSGPTGWIFQKKKYQKFIAL